MSESDLSQMPPSPFDDLIGFEITSASGSEVRGTLEVDERHKQPHGIVHGGVFATITETAVSIGANLHAGLDEQVVGISNHTDFLRAVSSGRLSLVAVPIQQGRTLQMWESRITDSSGRLVAHGDVRLMVMPRRSAGGG